MVRTTQRGFPRNGFTPLDHCPMRDKGIPSAKMPKCSRNAFAPNLSSVSPQKLAMKIQVAAMKPSAAAIAMTFRMTCSVQLYA